MYEVSGSRQCEPLLVSLSSYDGPVMVRRRTARFHDGGSFFFFFLSPGGKALTGKFKKIAFPLAYLAKKLYLCSVFNEYRYA